MLQGPITQNPILEAQVQRLLQELDTLPQGDKTSAALAITASLLEYAAYEMAQSDEARQVARLILLAADMDRTAKALQSNAGPRAPR